MAQVIPMPLPPDHEIEHERGDLVSQAGALLVTDQGSANLAGEVIQSIRALRKKVKETFDPIVESAHKAHRIACDKRSEHEAPLNRAETQLKARIGEWSAAEERKRREAAALAAAEARRLEDEARLREAEALEAAGEPEEAERVLEAPSLPPPVSAERVAPKVAGVSMRPVWKVAVPDVLALCKAIAEGKAATSLVEPNLSALQRLVAATDGQTVPPGCRVWQEQQVAARGGR